MGELELWLGGYARALELTARACRMGAPFAHGWKGAALLKLGRPARALKQLDHALSLFPNDAEARLWRAETNRELGRHREALKELETVLPEHRVWVLVNRALCRYALGDAAGMASDVESLPENVVAHVRARSGLEGPLDPARTARLLEAALRLGRGFRRAEYGQAVWLSRAH
ncbi:MAG: tetratricopeptide repeat protein [Elusimicrobiota bacterium]|nr:MAG: tetratricopeptide repeat protein [Elusimicrobiota bacterium]